MKKKWVCFSVLCGRVMFSEKKPKPARFDNMYHVCHFVRADKCTSDPEISKCWEPGKKPCPYVSHWRCP